ncbi:unnamed protein product [Musa acuminata subsp. malaccensis]|uniref:(wild Malaysian banana) hypothetical protein n=1 Tax=Musa acuminata subsp. malaccensis TaxID=214687 RepID=A0A804L0U8_MUSAM|nr:PREDICTED: lipid phosphate phosphatase gamma, chloroplastic-like [Musa acuminata subsp. malaccensis]CAG1854730.1 unnamed protein product [Musa acuminata subsp. malaccensis]
MTTIEVQNILCELDSSRNTNCGVGRYQKYDPSLQMGKSGSRTKTELLPLECRRRESRTGETRRAPTRSEQCDQLPKQLRGTLNKIPVHSDLNQAVSALRPRLKVVNPNIRYPRGDSLGHFLVWVSLIPVFISFGGFISHFIFRRELQGLCFALGLIISQVINELIKSSIQQSRPCAVLEVCDSHGWPSSHSQFIFFFSTYFSLPCLINGVGVSSPSSRRIIGLLPWPSAFLTLYSRVYLGYHTVPQVLAGSTLGLLLGAGWYSIVDTMLVDFFPAVEESAIGRFLYTKDSTHIPNVLKFEYDNARAARIERTPGLYHWVVTMTLRSSFYNIMD